MELDFFVAVSALFPLLVLTKVGDRHRRQSANNGDHEPRMHRLFIVVALVGEGFALAGAAKKGVGEPEETIVIAALVICGLIFCIELLRSGSPAWNTALAQLQTLIACAGVRHRQPVDDPALLGIDHGEEVTRRCRKVRSTTSSSVSPRTMCPHSQVICLAMVGIGRDCRVPAFPVC